VGEALTNEPRWRERPAILSKPAACVWRRGGVIVRVWHGGFDRHASRSPPRDGIDWEMANPRWSRWRSQWTAWLIWALPG